MGSHHSTKGFICKILELKRCQMIFRASLFQNITNINIYTKTIKLYISNIYLSIEMFDFVDLTTKLTK